MANRRRYNGNVADAALDTALPAAFALAMIAGAFMPWIVMDDVANSLTGVELSIYFINGTDRDFLLERSPLEAALFLALPIAILACAAYLLLQVALGRGAKQLRLAGGGALGAAVVFMFASRITLDAAHPVVGGIPIPLQGLLLTMLGAALLLAYGFMREDRGQRRGGRARNRRR